MQRVTSKSALGASTAARGLTSIETHGKLFTRRQEARRVQPINNGSNTGTRVALRHYPLVRNGVIYWGDAEPDQPADPNTRPRVSFIRGPLRGQKQIYTQIIAMAGPGGPIPHARIAYDPGRDEPYLITSAGTRLTSSEPLTYVGAGVIGFTYHEELGCSIVVKADKTVITAADSRDAHTPATLPSLVGVAFGSSAVIGKTPTHVLIPAGDIRSSAAGFLRSTNGTTYTLIPGITAIVDQPVVTYAEYIDGRLWLCTDRGLWSTGDNGDTWRMEIAQTARLSFIGRRANGGLLAAGEGIWHAPPGGGFTRVSTSSALWQRPVAHVPEQRLIYSRASLYSESGAELLTASRFDVSTALVRGYGGSAGMSPIGLAPDTDSTILVQTLSSGDTHFVRQDLGLYVPPETGAEIEIMAIGAGGSDSVLAAFGRNTFVSNLVLAAGGSHGGQSNFDASTGRPGDLATLRLLSGNGDASFSGLGLYEARGGPGIVIRGQEYGGGMTCMMQATFSSSLTPTFAAGSLTTRGGWSGSTAVWRGRIADPIPMIIGAGIEGWASSSTGSGRSQDGAVVIMEIA
jgi:hypothetical protein